MSNDDDIDHDIERAKAILAKGRYDKPYQPIGGIIFKADVKAAYKLLERFVAELQNFLQLFSDDEEPCEGYDHALAIWEGMKERESRLHDEVRRLRGELQQLDLWRAGVEDSAKAIDELIAERDQLRAALDDIATSDPTMDDARALISVAKIALKSHQS